MGHAWASGTYWQMREEIGVKLVEARGREVAGVGRNCRGGLPEQRRF